jgi:hypothetical protein
MFEWVATGNQGNGKADNFFNNGYFKMEDLRQIASGKDPMPVPLAVDTEGREYSQYEADGDAGHGSPAAAARGRRKRAHLS